MIDPINKFATLFKHADKVLHFIAGALIALLILWVTGGQKGFGFAGAFLAGLYKEFSDHTKRGNGGIQICQTPVLSPCSVAVVLAP